LGHPKFLDIRSSESRRGTQECVRHSPTDLIVSGGGVHNPQIMAHLAGFLPGVAISTSTDHGIDADAKEAIAFAVLAYQTWRRRPSNLPSATGARHAVVLGSITP
jgi:anhydro-N-acetylmuramic acid kinase